MKNNCMNSWLRLLIILFVIAGCSNKTSAPEPIGTDNLAYKWGKVSLEATANDTERFRPRPTVTSRFLGLVWTAVFDAWTRYDSMATPIYLKNVDRRPASEFTLKNKETAISYAIYRAMMLYFFSDSVMLTARMKEFGFDPADTSLDPTTAVGIGNLAAKAVIEARRNDGSNQMGNTEGCDGKPYSDYTGYKPVNPADTMNDLKRWQPKYFSDGKGGKFCPACLTPQWGKVKPLLLNTPDQFRPPPPPAIGSEELAKDVKEVVDLQANLTDEQKGLIEFMRDGPKSVQQAGHWFIFAQDVSERDKHTLDQDVQMYFLVEAAAMDAFIACWDAKMEYDFARPYSLVHDYYRDKIITGWAGPEKGMIQMKGQDWRPYSPETFLCPPFPSYVSGHSSVSGACAEVLRLYKGDDHFGIEVKRTPGEMTEPNRLGKPVVLKFPTFTEAANMAGMSRVMGGYHIQAENREGLKLGRSIATVIFEKYRDHMNRK
jgi:hypothetical protein